MVKRNHISCTGSPALIIATAMKLIVTAIVAARVDHVHIDIPQAVVAIAQMFLLKPLRVDSRYLSMTLDRFFWTKANRLEGRPSSGNKSHRTQT